MKKLLSLALAIMMLLSIMPLSLAAEDEVTAEVTVGLENFTRKNAYKPGQFTDFLSSDWFSANVITAYELGLVKGTTETNFNPKGNLTVAETIVLACRLHSIYNGGTGEFTQGSPWYQVYVDYALANRIIPGAYSDYNAKISRANFAFILNNALPAEALKEINNIANGALYDVKDDNRTNAIYNLYRAGVLTGSDKYGTFKPDSNIQRSEVATIVTRMADRTQRKMFVLEEKPLNPESVTLAGKTTINIGETTQWKATVAPAKANQWVAWSSGNPGVATVDAKGNIKGLKAGQSNITATAVNGVKKTVLLTVKSPHQIHYEKFPGVPDYGKIFGIEGHEWTKSQLEFNELDPNTVGRYTYHANDTYAKDYEVYKAEKDRVLSLCSQYSKYLKANGFTLKSSGDAGVTGYQEGAYMEFWKNPKTGVLVDIMVRYDGLATIITITR